MVPVSCEAFQRREAPMNSSLLTVMSRVAQVIVEAAAGSACEGRSRGSEAMIELSGACLWASRLPGLPLAKKRVSSSCTQGEQRRARRAPATVSVAAAASRSVAPRRVEALASSDGLDARCGASRTETYVAKAELVPRRSALNSRP